MHTDLATHPDYEEALALQPDDHFDVAYDDCDETFYYDAAGTHITIMRFADGSFMAFAGPRWVVLEVVNGWLQCPSGVRYAALLDGTLSHPVSMAVL